jgi:hypothetical protein
MKVDQLPWAALILLNNYGQHRRFVPWQTTLQVVWYASIDLKRKFALLVNNKQCKIMKKGSRLEHWRHKAGSLIIGTPIRSYVTCILTASRTILGR